MTITVNFMLWPGTATFPTGFFDFALNDQQVILHLITLFSGFVIPSSFARDLPVFDEVV